MRMAAKLSNLRQEHPTSSTKTPFASDVFRGGCFDPPCGVPQVSSVSPCHLRSVKPSGWTPLPLWSPRISSRRTRRGRVGWEMCVNIYQPMVKQLVDAWYLGYANEVWWFAAQEAQQIANEGSICMIFGGTLPAIYGKSARVAYRQPFAHQQLHWFAIINHY